MAIVIALLTKLSDSLYILCHKVILFVNHSTNYQKVVKITIMIVGSEKWFKSTGECDSASVIVSRPAF